MKKPFFYLGLSISFFVSLTTLGCGTEEAPAPDNRVATVSTRTTLYYPKVAAKTTPALSLQAPSIGITCDSLIISKARVFLSNVKLHHNEDDTTGSGSLKEGPFIATFSVGQTLIASFASLPAGIFDRIKFEVHKYNASLDTNIQPVTDLTDFITSERNTAIIEGTVYTGGIGYPFVYKSRITLNAQAQFPQQSILELGGSYTVFIDYFPEGQFAQSDGSVLDPRDPANATAIDNGMKTAFHSRTQAP